METQKNSVVKMKNDPGEKQYWQFPVLSTGFQSCRENLQKESGCPRSLAV